MFIGTFAMPLSVLIFFMEMNTPRNISIFRIISAVFAGGIASLLVTLFLFERLSLLSDILGASSAGIIEESAKLAVVILLFGRDDAFRWGQNGMLLGAAIGCGFAAFESAGYAFNLLVESDYSLAVFSQNIIMRAVHAPFTHIVWTANAAAALWFVKGDRPFSLSMLRKRLFVRVFTSSMLLHMLWNAPLGVFPIPVFLDLKYLLLGMVGLSISLRLIQLGLRQIMDERSREIERLAST
jgi:RsiW-degrading membrane proteinase PrsW (M82 family)